MAFSPEQAMNQMNDDDKKLMTLLEEDIDNTLVDQYFGESFNYLLKDDEFCKTKVVNEIKKKYNKVGWDVEYAEEDGGKKFLTFTSRVKVVEEEEVEYEDEEVSQPELKVAKKEKPKTFWNLVTGSK